jgi:uncharacterized membrane protein
VTKKFVVIYSSLAVLTAISYVWLRSYLILTPAGDVIVSNLTLNYVIVACLAGGLTGWLSWNRLFAKRGYVLRFTCTLVCTFIMAGLWLALMSASGGYQLR